MDGDPSPAGGPDHLDALAKAMSSTLLSAITGFDSRAASAAAGQDELCRALDRLTSELDRLLEEAPLPVAMQHSAKLLSIQRRIRALNALLASIQRRIDGIDQMLSARAGGRDPS